MTFGGAQRAPAAVALDRTVRLMRDHLSPAVSDAVLLQALLNTHVRIVADAANLSSPAAQSAFTTTTLLLLRSGTRVSLDAPDLACAGSQAPLTHTHIVSGLIDVSCDLIEGVMCNRWTPPMARTCDPAAPTGAGAGMRRVTAVLLLGDTPAPPDLDAGVVVMRLMGTALSAHATAALGTDPGHGERWDPALTVPLGALAVAGFAAAEVYKATMRTLRPWAVGRPTFDALFTLSRDARYTFGDGDGGDGDGVADQLARPLDLGIVDAISGGAIVHAALYCVVRLPAVSGAVRIIEPDIGEATNLNRYGLLRRSMLGVPKAMALAALPVRSLRLLALPVRFEWNTARSLGGLSDTVLVGVDHIPTRWAAQKTRPVWLGIGATSHYSAMSSAHTAGMPCAWCLHPTDAPDVGPIPTIAFVSHWAGLLLAWRLIAHRLGRPVPPRAQYDFTTPLRNDLPGAFWHSPVAALPGCPSRCARQRRTA
jgi:hypothetical protein